MPCRQQQQQQQPAEAAAAGQFGARPRRQRKPTARLLVSKEQAAPKSVNPRTLLVEVELFRVMREEGAAIYGRLQRAFYQKVSENPLDDKYFYKIGCAAALVNWTERYLHKLEVGRKLVAA